MLDHVITWISSFVPNNRQDSVRLVVAVSVLLMQ